MIARRAFANVSPMRFALLFLATASGLLAESAPPPDLTPVRKWIARQRTIESIESDFSQTRSLRTLRSPAVAQGKFWFRAPSSFRWQIGDPPKTIALGDGKEIQIIQPARRLVERSPIGRIGQKAGAQGFGMMSFPFADDFDDFQRRFEVLSIRTDGGRCHLDLLPRDAQARRFLAKVALDFDADSGKLLAFEIVTREGSSMRTDFRNTRVNSPLDPALFRYDFAGYQIRDAR
ncbi:MAG: outer membrane lipoprotein carrier protein LolA [Terrimicrobiaceae bacterium]|nr:outer membrane lipoprotein carrier protein LolA [Terrimicrobiaceae bacterium]